MGFTVPDFIGRLRSFLPHGSKPIVQACDRGFTFPSGEFVGFGEFGAKAFEPGADRGKCFHLAAIELRTEGFPVFAQGNEALFGNRTELIRLFDEFRQCCIHTLAQGCDLPFAGSPEFVQPFEAGNQVIELPLGFTAGISDLVRYILGGIGNDGKVSAQSIHIVQRGRADAGNRFDLITVIANQFLQPLRMLGQTIGRCAAEIIEFLGLGREELPGKAEFPIYGYEPGFEFGRLCRQRMSDIREPARFPGGIAHKKQPDRHDEQDRDGPLRDQSRPLFRRRSGGNLRKMRPTEETGPRSNRKQGDRRCDPSGRTIVLRFQMEGIAFPFFEIIG